MADLASLRIAVDSRPVDQASNDLDELATSANRAERATESLTNQTRATGAAMAGMNNAVRQARAAQEAAAQAMGGVAGRTRLASHEITNLAFQFQDLGVQIAGGANPLTALVQQGSQISGIMMQSGMSVGTFAKAVGSMLATAAGAVLLNPVFLGIAAAVGAVGLALNFMGDDIKKATGVTVTAGDIMLGTFDVIKKALKSQVSEAFKAMGLDAGQVWDDIVKYTRKAVNIIIGVSTAAPRMIMAAFRVLPSGIADAFYSAVNLGIRAINGLVERSVSVINNFVDAVNPILEKAGLSIGRLTAPRIAELENNYAGAASKAMQAFTKVATDTINRDYIGEIASVIGKAAANRAIERAAKKKGEKIGKDTAKAIKDTLAKELADLNLDAMNGLTDTMRELQERISAFDNQDMKQMMDEINQRADKRVEAAKEELEIRRQNNTELMQTVDYLDQTFGLGGNLGRLFSALKSGFGDVFDAIGGAFAGLRDSLSGLLANLGTSFKQVAAGAAIGGIAAKATGGSALGGTIGGGIGQALGSKFLSKALGSFAGPLGAIAGGLLGGLIGGLFTKTKQASATLSSIGGQAVISSIKGNDAQLKGIANSMANGLLKGIANIAEQLGGQLGGAVSLSIGKRKNDFVVDPTGQGRTKGAGVINFGEDQAAAVAYATQLAIQQGIITGLSAGANALIKAGGDLQAQVEKAMKFEQVFKDLRKETDPLGSALDELTKEFDKLQVIFKEAGATAADYAALEELYSIKRQRAIMEAERPRRELEIQLMELSGNTAGALAAQRELELQAMDESLRPLQQQIYALEDQAKAAEEAARANEELANTQRLVADEINALQRQLLQEQGNVAAIRQQELAALLSDEARAIQQEIWNIQEAREAAEKAAQAAEKAEADRLAAIEEAARQAAEAQQKAQEIAKQRQSMEIALLRAMGRESEALVAQRRLELEAMDESLRGLQQQIWAAEDAADARDVLRASYEREADALRDTAKNFRDLGAALRAFSADITGRILGTNGSSNNLRQQFAETSRLARLGNVQAMEALPQIGAKLADFVVENAGDRVAMIRELNKINIETEAAANVADRQASVAERQLDALTKQVQRLISIEERVVSVAEAINRLTAITAIAAGVPAPAAVSTATTSPSLVYNASQNSTSAENLSTREELAAMREEMKVALFTIAKNTAKTSDQLKRWDGDGMPDVRNYA